MFKVGDKVTDNGSSKYSITRGDFIGIVTEVFDDWNHSNDDIRVKVIKTGSHNSGNKNGREFSVQSKYFKLYQDKLEKAEEL